MKVRLDMMDYFTRQARAHGLPVPPECVRLPKIGDTERILTGRPPRLPHVDAFDLARCLAPPLSAVQPVQAAQQPQEQKRRKVYLSDRLFGEPQPR